MEVHAFAKAKRQDLWLVRPGPGTWMALRHPSGAELCTAEVVVTKDSYQTGPSGSGDTESYCALCISVVTVWERDEGSDVSSTAVAWFTTDGQRRFPPREFRQPWDPESPKAVARRDARANAGSQWNTFRGS